MWQQQPDYARYKEKLNGEGWLMNRQEGMLIQIKPDAPTNATCSVRFGELLPLVRTAWSTHQAAADAQTPRNRDVDQPAEDRLATLHNA